MGGLFTGDGKVGRMLFCNYNNDLVLWKGKNLNLKCMTRTVVVFIM